MESIKSLKTFKVAILGLGL